jgi:Glycosyl transferase family 2
VQCSAVQCSTALAMKSVHKFKHHHQHTKRLNALLSVGAVILLITHVLYNTPSSTSLTLTEKNNDTLTPIGKGQSAIAIPVLTDSLPQSNETAISVSVSVCVPAILKDYESGDLQRLLASIHGQTKPPTEIIVILSDASVEQCQIIQAAATTLVPTTTASANIQCRSVLQRQAASRNECAKQAKGDLIAFIDADDRMTPNKLQVVLELNELYRPKLILHGWTAVEQEVGAAATNASWREYPIMQGKQLHQLAQRTKAAHLWLHEFLIHSMVTISRHVTIQHREGEQYYREEDAWFVRDVIEHYGEHDDTAIYIQMPLGIYKAREHKEKGRLQ